MTLAGGEALFGTSLLGLQLVDTLVNFQIGHRGFHNETNGGGFTGSGAQANANGVAYWRLLRSPSPAFEVMDFLVWGFSGASITGFLDADTPWLPHSVVLQDMCYRSRDGVYADYMASLLFGFLGFPVAGDLDSAVGVFFESDTAFPYHWICKVAHGTGSPATEVHAEDSGVVATSQHRLTIILDGGATRRVRFFIDATLVSTYTPPSGGIGGQMGATGCPIPGHAMWTPANSSSFFYIFGGGNPALLQLID